MPEISVVIPTYDRLPQLKRTLAGLADQVGIDRELEVVVVSDGSTDGTDEWLGSDATPLPVVACFQANSGPAVARNRGIAAARGRLVLFLDDDVVPMPDVVSVHLARHGASDDLVVVGRMDTPDDVRLSPWVGWEQRMLYKQYDAMLRGDWEATPRQFYTGNASLVRRHVEAVGGFDAAFRRAEDVELAYRLADAGLEFVFAPDAVVLHYAERSFGAWRSNASSYGRNDVIFARDHGRAWLLDAVSSEFHGRHRFVQALTTMSLRQPRFGRIVTAAMTSVARAAGRGGLSRATGAALSAVYNLEYYRGMAEELGGPRHLLDRFDAAASSSEWASASESEAS